MRELLQSLLSTGLLVGPALPLPGRAECMITRSGNNHPIAAPWD